VFSQPAIQWIDVDSTTELKRFALDAIRWTQTSAEGRNDWSLSSETSV